MSDFDNEHQRIESFPLDFGDGWRGIWMELREGSRTVLLNHRCGERWSTRTCTAHTITEEPDGTLTFSPSIVCHDCNRHGFIEHSTWRSV